MKYSFQCDWGRQRNHEYKLTEPFKAGHSVISWLNHIPYSNLKESMGSSLEALWAGI